MAERRLGPYIADLKAKVSAADTILIVISEYAYSLPGVPTNAINRASRPGEHAWDGQPAGIMHTFSGMLGTGRAQYHLRQILVFLSRVPLDQSEVMIAHGDEKFDSHGQCK